MITEIINQLVNGDGLVVVGVQKDFCPGGSLAVGGGDQLVAPLNRWIGHARETGIPVYASRDWHPLNYLSFQEQGGKVAAALHPGQQRGSISSRPDAAAGCWRETGASLEWCQILPSAGFRARVI